MGRQLVPWSPTSPGSSSAQALSPGGHATSRAIRNINQCIQRVNAKQCTQLHAISRWSQKDYLGQTASYQWSSVCALRFSNSSGFASKHGAICCLLGSTQYDREGKQGLAGRLEKHKQGALPRNCTLSTRKSELNFVELQHLLLATGQSSDILRRGNSKLGFVDGKQCVQVLDLEKLKRAVEHSTVVVSIHVYGELPEPDYMPPKEKKVEDSLLPVSLWLPKQQPKRLVAFGRASSDTTLTASIHDLAVAPSLQGLGLGRRVLQRVVRELRQRGIEDIAALSTVQNRGFFQACKFGPDALGTTTMMYTQHIRCEQEMDDKSAV